MTQEAKDDNRKRHEERKLIGLFMGYKVREFYYPDKSRGISFYDKGGSFYEKRWDKYWDDLMPVVEKIESTELELGTICVDIESKKCEIKHYGDSSIAYEEGKTKIEAVYKAVIECIKWLNDQNNFNQ